MELKVKLIDGSDHRISLDDQATLGALRAAVLEATNVAVERQRLIFRGKVLSDDSKLLSAIGVTDGNVLHMVERAPVLANAAPLAPHPDEQRGHHHHHPRAAVRNVIVGNLPIQRQPDFNEAHTRELLTSALGRIGDIGRTAGVRFEQDARTGDTHVHVQLRAERQTAVDSPARERVDHVRRLLRHTNHLLYHIERDTVPALDRFERLRQEGPADGVSQPTCCPLSPEPTAAAQPATAATGESDRQLSSASVEDDSTAANMPPWAVGECTEPTHEVAVEPQQPTDAANEQMQSDGHPYTMRHGTVAELHTMFGDILSLQDRVNPQMQRYRRFLGDERVYADQTCEGRHMGHFLNGLNTALHNLSHMYHALSDLNIHLCEPPPRRLFPQYTQLQIDEPAEADITLTFSNNTVGADQAAAAAGMNARLAGQPPPRGAFPLFDMAPNRFAARPPTFRMQQMGNFPPRPPSNIRGPAQVVGLPPGFPLMFPGGVQQASMQMHIGPDGQVRMGQPIMGGQQQQQPQFGGVHPPRMPTGAPRPNAPAGQPQAQPPQLQNFLQGLLQNAMGGMFGRPPAPANAPQQPTPPRPQASAANAARPPPPQQQQQQQQDRPTSASTHTAGGAPTQQQQPTNTNQQPHRQQNRMLVGRSAIPWQQTSDMTAQHAVFVGPRPPAELPLFTLDPFLPCPSRHFDPRLQRRQQQQRQAAAAAAASTAPPAESPADSQPATGGQQPPTLQPGQTRVNRDGRAVFESDEEFVNFVEHIFRSVVNNMTEVTAGAAARAADDGTQRLYAFQPVMQAIGQTMPLITGTISVEAFTQPPAQEHGHPEGAPAGGNGNEGTEGGTGQPPNMMAIFGRIAQELATGMNQPLGEFLRSMGENIDEGGRGYGHLVTGVVSETLGLNDVIALFNGDRSPLDRARTQIRRYMIENTLNDNARPTENDLRSAAERLAADPLDVLHLLQPVDVGARLRPLDSTGRPIDLIASIVRADQAAVERSLRLVFGVDPCVDANGAEISFGQALMGSVEMYGRQMVCLLNMGFDGQPYGYEAVLRRYIANQQEDRSEMIISWMNESGIPQLRGMVDRFPRLTEADVRPLLVFVDETPTAPSPASMASSENSQASRIDDRTNTMQPPAASSIINSDAAPRSNASSSSQSRPMDDSDQSWKRVLPADWVAVIEEDVERQRSVDQTQRPMSDAYITGMPAKRRKLVMRDRPMLSNGAALESALRETLASAVVESGATPVTGATVDDVVGSAPLGEALIDAFRAQFHDDVRRRLRADPDYDPDKLPATNAYFNP